MSYPGPRSLAVMVCFVILAPLFGQEAAFRARLVLPPPDDEPMPTLLGMITARFAKIEVLRPSSGVKIKEAKFSRGVIRIIGTVTSAEQRQRVRREVEAMRRDIESTLDLKVKEIDVSELTVLPGPGKPKDKEKPKEKERASPTKPPLVPLKGPAILVFDSAWLDFEYGLPPVVCESNVWAPPPVVWWEWSWTVSFPPVYAGPIADPHFASGFASTPP